MSAAPVVIDPATVNAPVLEARGITRLFGSLKALNNVTFDIPAGVICGLIGPNGAGKTTLLRILAGLDEPDEGTRSIDGVDVALNPHAARSRFGYVPDFAALYDGLTVEGLVRFFARAQGVDAAEIDAAVTRALQAAGLQSVADRAASALSKGMTQRACVACALVHDPSVLFLDEPASGLDPRARIELKELLKELRAAGKTIFISSHILSELGDLVDRVLILERGVVKANGTLDVAWQSVQTEAPRVRLEVTHDAERAQELLRKMSVVAQVTRDGLALTVSLQFPRPDMEPGPVVADIVKALVGENIPMCAVVPVKANLESLFMTVTKGELQ
jgi:ABC-2 type transport system ATP-binding protein